MPSRSRLAWLEPLDVDESTPLSPLYWKDILVLDSAKAYLSVGLAGVFSAALVVGLGLGRPALCVMVVVAHYAVIGLVVGIARISGRVWTTGGAKTDS